MTPRDLPRVALEALLEQAAAGMPLSQSCRIAGVSKSTVYAWLRERDGESEDVRDFRTLYEAATAERIRTLVDAMTSHAAHDWRAALVELKRHLPEIYGDGVAHEDRADMLVMARRTKQAEAREAEARARIRELELLLAEAKTAAALDPGT